MRIRRAAVVALLAGGAVPSTASAAPHLVMTGETLSGIAAANGISTSALAAANGVSPESFAIEGTTLEIPAPGSAATTSTTSSATSSQGAGHYVTPGETLSGIAAANGITTAALAAANGVSDDSFAIAGTTLKVPAAGTGSSASGIAGETPAPLSGYRVRLGNTLSEIAARHGVGLSDLASYNGLDPSRLLLAGTSLKLPGGSSSSTSHAAIPPETSTSSGPVPTSTRLDAGTVSSIASSQGAPGALAAAIGWQESGFNNSMVSIADARGVMQVIPTTWDYVQQNLTSEQLDPSSATDNVKAGALLIKDLLAKTGDEATAIAAYYQGLGSVTRIGMLPETRQYVANVQALKSRFEG